MRAVFVVLFWGAAAMIVTLANAWIVLKLIAIIVIGFAYMALTAREATIDHALFVGTLWLLFAIVAEAIATQHFGRVWAELLGPPSKPLYRCLLMFAWVGAPALFARNR